MRRFDIPSAPVAGRRGDLLRLVEPRGLAVTWLDLRAGAIIGYAVRPEGTPIGGWRELLRPADRDADPDAPVGGTIAIGWPWAGEAPSDPPVRWQLVERDPTAATLTCRCASRRDPARVADLSLTARLDEGRLQLRLVAQATVAVADLRPEVGVFIPGTAQHEPRTWSDTGSVQTCVLGADAAALRLDAESAPPWRVSWSRSAEAAGSSAIATIVPPDPSEAAADRYLLTVTVGPLASGD